MQNNKKSIHNPKYQAMIAELVKLRNSRNLTQRDLAACADVSHCFIGRTETCERRLDIIETIELLKTMQLTKPEIIKFIEKLI